MRSRLAKHSRYAPHMANTCFPVGPTWKQVCAVVDSTPDTRICRATVFAGWDGGTKPSYFIAFKAVWCIFVGLTSIFVGFMSTTCEKTVTILRQRAAASDPDTPPPLFTAAAT